MGRMCGGCDRTWSGLKVCHCSASGCHRTFNVLSNFDAHRSRGKCIDPASLKDADGNPRLKLNKYGTWVGATVNQRFAKDEDDE